MPPFQAGRARGDGSAATILQPWSHREIARDPAESDSGASPLEERRHLPHFETVAGPVPGGRPYP